MTNLFKECLRFNLLTWPKFANIYSKLIVLKKKFIIEIIQEKTPYFGASKDKSHQNIEL